MKGLALVHVLQRVPIVVGRFVMGNALLPVKMHALVVKQIVA